MTRACGGGGNIGIWRGRSAVSLFEAPWVTAVEAVETSNETGYPDSIVVEISDPNQP